MAWVSDRLVPHLGAAVAGCLAAIATSALLSPPAVPTVLTATHAIAAGARVGPLDLTESQAASVPRPSFRTALYAAVPLRAGEAVLPGALTTQRPSTAIPLGRGIVAENVTLPANDVAPGVGAGDVVAAVGDVSGSQTELLASAARVVAEASIPAALGAAATRVYTLSLPLGSAMAVATAAHNGSLDLLPWTLPRSEVPTR